MRRRIFKVLAGLLLGVVLVALAAWTYVGYASTRDIETPAYTLAAEGNGYEVREYAPYIRAEVTLQGAYRDTLYGGFRNVADYIFGNNTTRSAVAMTAPALQEPAGSETIAMTAPVLQEPAASEDIAMTAPVLNEQEGGAYTVSFIMPSSYTMETLPQPNNDKVKLRAVPKTRFAVLNFGGYATERRSARKTAWLQERLTADGLLPAGPPIVAQYDPPWTPPYMRRNEIQIPLKDAAAG
jgi:hypothetical protein